VISIVALGREIDEVMGVKDVRLRAIAFIEYEAVPHPYCVRVDP
jgi:hypothetical protein